MLKLNGILIQKHFETESFNNKKIMLVFQKVFEILTLAKTKIYSAQLSL